MRTGMMIGAVNGNHDDTRAMVLFGSRRVGTTSTTASTTSIVTGSAAWVASSWFVTMAPIPANRAAQQRNPRTQNATSARTDIAVIDGNGIAGISRLKRCSNGPRVL